MKNGKEKETKQEVSPTWSAAHICAPIGDSMQFPKLKMLWLVLPFLLSGCLAQFSNLNTIPASISSSVTTTSTTTTPSTSSSSSTTIMMDASMALPNGSSITSSSPNYAGYAISTFGGSNVTHVSADWRVPLVTYGSVAQWIGIMATQGNTYKILQIGTLSDATGTYMAWHERWPVEDYMINTFNISPGDAISASITSGTSNSWLVSLKDLTNGQSFSHTLNYSISNGWAAWIVEAPDYYTGNFLLGTFDYAGFTNASATINGASANLCGLTKQEFDLTSVHALPIIINCTSFYVSYKGS